VDVLDGGGMAVWDEAADLEASQEKARRKRAARRAREAAGLDAADEAGGDAEAGGGGGGGGRDSGGEGADWEVDSEGNCSSSSEVPEYSDSAEEDDDGEMAEQEAAAAQVQLPGILWLSTEHFERERAEVERRERAAREALKAREESLPAPVVQVRGQRSDPPSPTALSRLSRGSLAALSRLPHGSLAALARLSRGSRTALSRLSRGSLTAVQRQEQPPH
jgi:hypothetical protein